MVETINEKAVKSFSPDKKYVVTARNQTNMKWKKVRTSKSVSSL